MPPVRTGTGPGQEGRRRPPSDYREIPAPPSLGSHLLCLWTQRIGEGDAAYPQLVLPDACLDVVFVDDAPPVVAGPATRAFIAALPPRSTVVGARCRPGLAQSLLGLPAPDLVDQEAAPLADVCRRLAARLSGRRDGPPTIAGRLAAVEAALAAHVASAGPVDRLVVAAVGWLARHPARPVRDLARSLGTSERQLHRRVTAAVGYGPKTLQRVLRFQRLLALAGRAPLRPGALAALALAAGYADQAHMTREVGRLAGRPPTALVPAAGTTLGMSDLFKTGSRPAE